MSKYHLSEDYLSQRLGRISPPYVFLDTANFDKENKEALLFSDFVDVLTFNSNDDIDSFFRKIDDYLKKGYWLCGYFSYEFGYFLEPALNFLAEKNSAPLAWLGVCEKPEIMPGRGKISLSSPGLGDIRQGHRESTLYKIENIKPNVSREHYFKRIKKIKCYLEQGLTYQVNYTFKLKFDFHGEVLDLYFDLRRAQPTPYSAVINTGRNHIFSLSPELFFRAKGERIVTRPMKGTIKRGVTLEEDRNARRTIKRSLKIRAENLMIVDLLRNDLGKVADKVYVPDIFRVEIYRTLYQMTSTIEAKLKKRIKFKDVFSSLFPSGSITGAPKIKTMEIIKSIEKEPRGIYTGAIGYISPRRQICFNVAIRTIDIKGKKGELGIGGGIVYDSEQESEYNEALLKAKFFIGGLSKVCLIESVLWEDAAGYSLLDLHLKRLKRSCSYFFVPLNMRELRNKLEKAVSGEKGKWKIRVLVDMKGKICIGKKPLGKDICLVKVKVSSVRTTPEDCFLYHKTTQRDIYDRERKGAEKEGCFEVIFLNTRGEVTEGSITNIFILKNNQLYTPALKSGLLPGVLRENLLREGRVKEKVLCYQDILNADKIYIGNSVRGLIEAVIHDGQV